MKKYHKNETYLIGVDKKAVKPNKDKWEEELMRLFAEFTRDWATHTNWEENGKPGFDKIKEFIAKQIKLAKEDERGRIKRRVGILRQLLNEERIADPYKMIDDEYIESVLEITAITKNP